MLTKLLAEYEKHDNAREQVISASRDVIRLSKKVISSIHNERVKDAEKYALEMEKKVGSMRKQRMLADTGSYSAAIQEYVEALLLLEYAKSGSIAEPDKFECTPDEYISGLCDFVGELQRRAVLKVSKGDRAEIGCIYKDVSRIYDSLLDFSFRGDVRKKFDLVKYVVIRLEEIMLELKLNQK